MFAMNEFSYDDDDDKSFHVCKIPGLSNNKQISHSLHIVAQFEANSCINILDLNIFVK